MTNDHTKRPIGLLGLGHIGLAFARILRAKGHEVFGYRRGDGAALEEVGGHKVSSSRELAENCDLILLVLPDITAAQNACDGADGLLAGATARTTVIDVTSAEPAGRVAFAEQFARAGVSYLEAPVSGTAEDIEAGKGIFLVGGTKELTSRHLGVLQDLAGKAIHVGEMGAASAIKSAALMLIGINLFAVAEALAFAEKFGVAPALAVEALKTGAPSSAALLFRGPRMVSGDYAATVATLQSLTKMLSSLQPAAPVSDGLLERTLLQFSRAIGQGLGSYDPAVVFEAIRPRSDLKASLLKPIA